MKVIRRYRLHHDHCQDQADRFFARAADIAAQPPVPLAALPAEPPAEPPAAAGGGEGGEGAVAAGDDEAAVSFLWLHFVFCVRVSCAEMGFSEVCACVCLCVLVRPSVPETTCATCV